MMGRPSLHCEGTLWKQGVSAEADGVKIKLGETGML